jgi:hypothetical protein
MQSQNIWETSSCPLLAILSKATSPSDRSRDTRTLKIVFRLLAPPCFSAGGTGDKRNFEVDQKPSLLSRVGNSRSRKMLKRLVFYRVCSLGRARGLHGSDVFGFVNPYTSPSVVVQIKKIHILSVN